MTNIYRSINVSHGSVKEKASIIDYCKDTGLSTLQAVAYLEVRYLSNLQYIDDDDTFTKTIYADVAEIHDNDLFSSEAITQYFNNKRRKQFLNKLGK